MKKTWIAVPIVLLALSACTRTIEMQNPQTGENAKCGPYKTVGIPAISEARLAEKCISDYQARGFQRVSK